MEAWKQGIPQRMPYPGWSVDKLGKIQTFMRTASSEFVRMYSERLRINLLAADAGVGLFC
jgi:hypothetical protein